jgi:hypothetical protein
MTKDDIALFEQLTHRAQEEHDGHLTIMRFTTNWRVGFDTPQDREAIDEMHVGKTFAEAATTALRATPKQCST